MPLRELNRAAVRSRDRGPAPTARPSGRARLLPDPARYVCGCGHAFRAEVSTGVACPRCGHGQAW